MFGVLGEAEFGQHLVDARGALGRGDVGREAQLGAELERLADAQRGVQQVLLRHVADPAAQFVVAGVEVAAGVPDRARIGRPETGERVQQRRLAGAGRADDGEQRAGRQLEADLVHQLLRAGEYGEVLGLEADVAGVDEFDQPAALDLQQVVADGDDVAVVHRRLDDALPVDEGAVGRAEVDDLGLVVA